MNPDITGANTAGEIVNSDKSNEVQSSVYSDVARGASAPVQNIKSFNTMNEQTESVSEIPEIIPHSDMPMPVVKVLSVRGVEYLFMSIFLWLAAGSFTLLILSAINGETGFSVLAFPLSMLIVTLPGFAMLFLRLKKAELSKPELRFDPSKRRLTQITQVLAFLTCLINLITYIYIVLQKIGGESNMSIAKVTVNVLVIMIVAGGILAYYWRDEHKVKT